MSLTLTSPGESSNPWGNSFEKISNWGSDGGSSSGDERSRRKAVEDGEMTIEEARKLKRKATRQDAEIIGASFEMIKGAVSGTQQSIPSPNIAKDLSLGTPQSLILVSADQQHRTSPSQSGGPYRKEPFKVSSATATNRPSVSSSSTHLRPPVEGYGVGWEAVLYLGTITPRD